MSLSLPRTADSHYYGFIFLSEVTRWRIHPSNHRSAFRIMDAFKTPLPYVTLMNTASISKCRCEIKRPLFFWMAEASASALAVIRLTTGGNFAREINTITIYL